MKLLLYTILYVLWLTPASAADEPSLGSNLAELLDYAREHNLEFAAARYETDAALQRVQPAGALPDPVFRTELHDFTNKGTDTPVSLLPNRVNNTYYRVMQTVPFWGKRDLKREVAAAEAMQAQGRSSETWVALSARIKKNYAQYYLYAHSENLTHELLDLLNNLEQVAQARYATGLVPQQDVIRAQVEQTELRRDLVMVETDQHHAMTRLNTLLQRPPYEPLAQPQRLRPLPAADKLAFAVLEDRLKTRNPQLFTLDAQITAAEKSRELTMKNRYPDFAFGLAPTQMGGKIREWELMFELNIPLQQQSRRSREREADALLSAAQARKEAEANQLLSDLVENLLALSAAQRIEVLTTSSLLPQTETTFQAALVGYQNGKVDFATLLDAQRQILKAKLDVLNAQVEAQIRLAEIEKLLGEEL